MNYFVGIDPGMTGALAIVDEGGKFVDLVDYPGDPAALWESLHTFCVGTFRIAKLPVSLCVIEKAAIMPADRVDKGGKHYRQGIASMAKFQINFGQWQMLVCALRWPNEEVIPHTWRKALGRIFLQKMDPAARKKLFLAYARRRWPEADDCLRREKDHNRAEAIMIAEYARIKMLGQGVAKYVEMDPTGLLPLVLAPGQSTIPGAPASQE